LRIHALLTPPPPHGWHADSDLSYNTLTGVPDNFGNLKAVSVCVCPLYIRPASAARARMIFSPSV
jgi:hypothetical protein